MKYLLRFSLVALIALLISANSFAEGFEGIVQIEITSPKMGGSKMSLTTYIKGEKSLTEMSMPQGNMKIYVDQEKHKSIMVMEAMKIGMEMDMSKAKDLTKKSDDAAPTIEATTEKQMISGHNCVLYRVTTKNGEQSNWWMTKDVSNSILSSLKNIYNNGAAGLKGRGPSSEAIEEMFKKGLVPIQIESLKDGKPEATITFVKFEKKDIEDSMFKIADDIKIQQMPAGMGGMGGQ